MWYVDGGAVDLGELQLVVVMVGEICSGGKMQ